MSIQPDKIMAIPTLDVGDQNSNLVEICKYLKRYGYLPAKYRLREQRLDKELSAAIRSFQVLTGLMKRGSGKTSLPTRRLMVKKRCGSPHTVVDKRKRPKGPLRAYSAEVSEVGWDHRRLTYKFGSCELVTRYGLATVEEAKSAVLSAFDSWQSAGVGLQFSESSDQPEMTFEWYDAINDPECETFGCQLSDLDHAHADYPPPNTQFYGVPLPIHFNAGERWGIRQEAFAFDIETIALHEIGHCLGLFHGPGDVMKEFRQEGEIVRIIDPITSSRLRRLYP